MKKYLIFVFVLLLIPVAVFSQVDDIPPIEDLGDWVNRFDELITSLPGVILSVIFLPSIVIGFFNQTDAKKTVKYLITGAIILGLTLAATIMDVGFLHGAKIWFVGITFGLLLLGQVIGYALVPGFFDLIADKLNPWKPKPVE
ncbi:hypothetical protein KA005_47655 [bacterium]|nr:hypothetical protein [bacterium]